MAMSSSSIIDDDSLPTPVSITCNVCVIGRGLIGSAAAKYVSMAAAATADPRNPSADTSEIHNPDQSSHDDHHSVVAIGPEEPKGKMGLQVGSTPNQNTDVDDGDGGQEEIIAAHYDEGRITRRTDPDPVWALLAQRSIERYRDIERESQGICFYHEVGHLVVGRKNGSFLRSVKHAAAGVDVDVLDEEALAVFMDMSSSSASLPTSSSCSGGESSGGISTAPLEGLLERSDSGWVSARKQVEAQLAIAARHGCKQVRVAVKSVDPDSGSGFIVHGCDGSIVRAHKILIAAGSNTDRLLRTVNPNIRLDLHIKTAQTLKLRLSDDDLVRCANMPSIICKDDAYESVFYLLPPIVYPADGCRWFKIGGGRKVVLDTHGDVVRWYRRQWWDNDQDDTDTVDDPLHKQYQANEEGIKSLLERHFPGVRARALEIKGDTCATVHTSTQLPYIGAVLGNPADPADAQNSLFVATGGNGAAAKSADEIGRLAAISVLTSGSNKNHNGDDHHGGAGVVMVEWMDPNISMDMFRPLLL